MQSFKLLALCYDCTAWFVSYLVGNSNCWFSYAQAQIIFISYIYFYINFPSMVADKLLSGETKLCLTTSSLATISANFRRVSDLSEDDERRELEGRGLITGSINGRLKKKVEDVKLWRDDVRTLQDFVVKTKGLKVNTIYISTLINFLAYRVFTHPFFIQFCYTLYFQSIG